MPGLQRLFDSFAPAPNGSAQDGELVLQHPLTSMRLALKAPSQNIVKLAAYGWTIANENSQPAFNSLVALRRAFPALVSQSPDILAQLLNPESVRFLLESQPEGSRGRMARWLISRSQSIGSPELALWTNEACRDLPLTSDHPIAPTLDGATYLKSPGGVARVAGDELNGYTLLMCSEATGRTHLIAASTLDDFWFPNNEWSDAQWAWYEQLLTSRTCTEHEFSQVVSPELLVAATAPQHLDAQRSGLYAYLGEAAEAIRRRFKHEPTARWLDDAGITTGISPRSADGISHLTDLYLIEHLNNGDVDDHILPAMRAADEGFAKMGDDQLRKIWRSAYEAVSLNAPAVRIKAAFKFRTEESFSVRRSTAESMREILSGYYGQSAIESLEQSGKLHLVTHASELPSEYFDEIQLAGPGAMPSAFYIEGAVYMIGANIDPDRVSGTFLHEVGEHAALSQMLGADYGRIVTRYNQLLAAGDTYALQAAMAVPASTHPANLSSEHLAYLIQLAAQDMQPRAGGEDGFELGQRCIRDLRTWLFRQPLMRDLERQGELENFKLDPQDIATLAREAVDYHVAGTTIPSLEQNQWESLLDAQTLSVLHAAGNSQRVDTLREMSAPVQMAYLYSLASLDSPNAHETLVSMCAEVAAATTSSDLVTRAMAGEITALTLRLSSRGRATDNLQSAGLFAAISGADDPETSVMTIIRQVGDGEWRSEHYSKGIGLTLTETFDSIEEAAATVGHTHFAVDPAEFDTVIAQWGQVLAPAHSLVDSLAFKRWHTGSIATNTDGSPMILYHGTASDFSHAKGMFWASAPTTAGLRSDEVRTPAPAAGFDATGDAPRTEFEGSGVAPNTGEDGRESGMWPPVSSALKGSTLAEQYAEMRQDFSLYNEDEKEPQRALVMPVYLSARAPFDADMLESSSLQIGSFRDELVRQAVDAGRVVNLQKIGGLIKTLRLAARNEESGPYYSAHNFWSHVSMSFGGIGHAAIRQLFAECGFDSVKYTEQGHLSLGVFEPWQVKSAIGNVGLFTASPDMRFSFAGVKAVNHNHSRLQIAKQMHEQSVSPEQIWNETGWLLGAEDSWRFEFDDSSARIRGYDFDKNEPEVTTTDPTHYMDWADEALNSTIGVPLRMVLDHPALFEAYPQLQTLRVKAYDRRPDEPTYGYFAHHPQSFARSKLFVATPWTSPAGSLLSTISHELQHGIQQIEGFASGATEETFALEVQDTSPYLKGQMQKFVDIEIGAKELGCSPETYAVMSCYEPDVIERVKTWQGQGNWNGNIASFRRSLMTPYALYFHEAGEVEARNTQSRLSMNAEERTLSFPGDTTDVDNSLVKATRFIYSVAASNDEAQGQFERADSSLGWALKTHRWHDNRQDNAELVHAGGEYNLFLVAGQNTQNKAGEIFAVSLKGDVVGSFLYGQGSDTDIRVAAMVAPAYRRQGIASAAYDAVERLIGKPLAKGAGSMSDSASGFWRAREAKAASTGQTSSEQSLLEWFGDSHTTNANDAPKTFYHGTLAAFSHFDAARHRSILNNRYQGDAFHFSESPEVASSYAVAARNQLFRQHDVFAALESLLAKAIADLFKGFVIQGDSVWNDISPEEFRTLNELASAGGYDLNDVRDVASYVEGSACASVQENVNLFATQHDDDMPEDIKSLAQAMGLGEAIPTPLVMPVYLRCTNTLYTDDREQAQAARSQGYDSVCYSGEDTVAGQREWMVFDPKNIRSVFEFNKDAKLLKPQQSSYIRQPATSPIAAPADASFDLWFADSHCKNLFGEPRLVFVQINSGLPFQEFGDADTASVDAHGRITPAYLAIRSPFVVTNSVTISQADLRDKIGDRKAAMLMGDLSRDGQLHIEDIIKNPRGAKWLEQAGFDGAIYRNRAGCNCYILLGSGQAMTASAVSRDLSGPVVWSEVPKRPAQMFAGERALAKQFTLTNLNKPHGHVVPIESADQFLAGSDRLYANWLNGVRITAPWIAEICSSDTAPASMKDFLKQNRKSLIGKNRIEDVFVSHMANLREGVEDARREGRFDSAQANFHRVKEDRLLNALAWAMDSSTRCQSTRGVVAADLLQWNKSLAEQSPMVQQALQTLGIDGFYQVECDGVVMLQTGNRYNAEQSAAEYPGGSFRAIDPAAVTGRACYEELANDLGGSKWASSVLASMGILGAQQSSMEVMLFQPEFNHQPQARMSINSVPSTAMKQGPIQLQDLGGIQIDAGVDRACQSVQASKARALEVIEANIRLLMAREVNKDLHSGSTVVNTVQTRDRLSNARALKNDLMFMVSPRDYLSWKEPMAEHHLKMLAPLIQLNHAHGLPGSAAFELLSGQHGVVKAIDLLKGVGFAGVHADQRTVCWSAGALKAFNIVSADTPRASDASAEQQAIRHKLSGMRACQ